jgi:transposase
MDKDSALFPLIPASTVRAARALYGRGNLYLRLGDRLNHLVSKLQHGMFSAQLAENKTALLAVLTIIQYVEKMTDVEMAEAIQRRMDLRYALHLATPSPGLDPDSLCAFRNRIMTDPQCRSLFQEIFKVVYPEITSTAMKEEPHIDDVLNSICENEVRATVVEAMLQVMEALSANHFNWLRQIALPHWYQRYNRSLVVANLDASFRKEELTGEDIQGDIQHLLYEIRESNSPEIMQMPETKRLYRIWEQLSEPSAMKDCKHCINKIF